MKRYIENAVKVTEPGTLGPMNVYPGLSRRL